MAITVPYYQESQRIGTAPSGGWSINGRALDLASGRQAWGAVQQAGQTLQQTGGLLSNIAVKEAREHNQTVALERLTEFEKRAQALQAEQAKRQGQNALASNDGKTAGVADVMRTSLEAYHTELTEGMNDAQKRLFEIVYQNKAQNYGGWAQQYQDQQYKAWTGTVEDGHMALNAQNAIGSVNDHKAFFTARDNIQAVMRIRGQREKWDEAHTQAQTDAFLSKNVYSPVLENLISSGDLKTAQGFLKQFSGEMGGELVAGYQRKIKNEGERLEAKAEKAQFNGMVSGILSGVSDLPTLEEQREAAFAQAKSIADPKLRDKACSEVSSEMAWRETRRDATTTREVSHYQELARKQGWTPRQAAEQIENATISESAKEKLRKDYDGKAEHATPQNRAALEALRRQIDLGAERGGFDRKDSDAIDASIYRNGLTYEQGQKARSYAAQGGAMGGLSQTQIDRAFKSLFPKKKQTVISDDLYELVASELEPGKPVTDAHVRQIMARLYTESKWEASDWFPDADRSRIEQTLREQNIKVTPERVRRLYWEEHKGKR